MGLLNFTENLLKAAVSVAVAPAAIVVDALLLPVDADDPRKGAFDRTGNLLSNAGKCLNEAVKPTKE